MNKQQRKEIMVIPYSLMLEYKPHELKKVVRFYLGECLLEELE